MWTGIIWSVINKTSIFPSKKYWCFHSKGITILENIAFAFESSLPSISCMHSLSILCGDLTMCLDKVWPSIPPCGQNNRRPTYRPSLSWSFMALTTLQQTPPNLMTGVTYPSFFPLKTCAKSFTCGMSSAIFPTQLSPSFISLIQGDSWHNQVYVTVWLLHNC